MKLILLVLCILISRYGAFAALSAGEIAALNQLKANYPTLAFVPTFDRVQVVGGVSMDIGPAWDTVTASWCDAGPGWLHHGVHCSAAGGPIDALVFTSSWGEENAPLLFSALSGLAGLTNVTFEGPWSAAMEAVLDSNFQLWHWRSTNQPSKAQLQSNVHLKSLAIPLTETMNFDQWTQLEELEILTRAVDSSSFFDWSTIPANLKKLIAPSICTDVGNTLNKGNLEVVHLCETAIATNALYGGSGPNLRELHLRIVSNLELTIHPAVSTLRVLSIRTTDTNTLKILGLPSTLTSLYIDGLLHTYNTIFPASLLNLTIRSPLLPSIPDSLSTLENLTHLVLDDPSGSGTWLANLPDLGATAITSLELTGATMTGPTLQFQICSPRLSTLRKLSLNSCSNIGSLPSCITELEVDTLTISALSLQSPFVGSLPPSLKELTISDSPLSFPDGNFDWSSLVTQCPEMKKVIMDYNQLGGPFPHDSLTRLVNLQHLELDGNHLGGTIPSDFFTSLPEMTAFLAAHNFLTGTVPASGWENLEHLNLHNNQLEAFPRISSSLSKLLTLNLGSNQLRSIPPDEDFATGTAMRTILLEDNPIGGPVPTFWASLPEIALVNLGNSGYEGSIPPIIQAPQLTMLHLDRNSLCGSLPQFIDSAPATVKLSNNTLSGSIPESWRTNVFFPTALALDHNRLEGALSPDWLSSMGLKRLLALDLNYNLFTGPFPSVRTWNSKLEWNAEFTMFDFCSADPGVFATMNCSVAHSFYSSCSCADSYYSTCSSDTCTPAGETTTPAGPIYPTPTPVCVQPNPRTPASATCHQPIPQGFTCVNGFWTALTDINTPSITFPPNSGSVYVNGNLTVGDSITFAGLGTSIIVDGCVSLGTPTIVIELETDNPTSEPITLITQKNGCPQSLANINIELKQPKSCKRTFAKTEGSTASSLVVVFSVDSSRCNIKYIIIGSVLGGVVIIAIITVTLLATFNKKFRNFCRPHAKKAASA